MATALFWSILGLILFVLGWDILAGRASLFRDLAEITLCAVMGVFLIATAGSGTSNLALGAVFLLCAVVIVPGTRRRAVMRRARTDAEAADHLGSMTPGRYRP